MLAHRVEGQRIDVDILVGTLQETARRTDFFDNEMTNAEDKFAVEGGQDALLGRGTEFNGDEIDRPLRLLAEGCWVLHNCQSGISRRRR